MAGILFHRFFSNLRQVKIPVSTREYLTLLEALDRGAIDQDIDSFYAVSRATLIKDERNFDKFDKVFAHLFEGVEALGDIFKVDDEILPENWLRAELEKHLNEEDKAALEAMGFDELMRTLHERLAEQTDRHQGGQKWIGTGGTSPYGNSGWNPAGIRMGGRSSNKQAVKVWEHRRFKDYDNERELGTRNLKIALRRLRKFARDGAEDELDLDNTIRSTAQYGYLDVKMRPERRNTIKVLVFFDVGGSMDPYIQMTERLFSAASSVFKNLEYFYFHNCVYEGVWRSNLRRANETISLFDVLNKYPNDYKIIVVGDAAMAPTEITHVGGSVEHWNEEAGGAWLRRIRETYPHMTWLNPTPEKWWPHTYSVQLVQEIIGANRMFPLTLEGVDNAMKELSRR